MRHRFTLSGYIILGLIAIGVLVSFRRLVIPICVLGIIFLLYKFPPSRWGRIRNAFQSRTAAKTKNKRKDNPFRVINGNKSDDSEDRPRYH